MDHITALTEIIRFGDARDAAFSALADFGNESQSVLVSVSKPQLAAILIRYLHGEISAEDLELWANIIECRHDIDFQVIEDYIYALANSEQMGGIAPDIIQQMLTLLAG